MARPNSKEAILDAAEAIVVESGAAHMTLDAVAERSQISKGGLMYNFPSKEALLEGMIGRLMQRCDQLRENARQELPKGQSNELMVEIKMFMDLSGTDQRLNGALLAVVANQPELMNAFRAKHRARFCGEITSEERFERSSILFFAALGMHFQDLLNISPLGGDQRKKIFDELLRLAGGGEGI